MLYPIAIEIGNEEQGFGVIVPDLPGCFSAGDTLEEAFANAKEAIIGHIGLILEDGEEIPSPTSIDNHRRNPEFTEYNMIFGVVEVDISPLLGKSERINITLPSRLLKHIDDYVATHPEYKNRSNFLARVATKQVFAGVI